MLGAACFRVIQQPLPPKDDTAAVPGVSLLATPVFTAAAAAAADTDADTDTDTDTDTDAADADASDAADATAATAATDTDATAVPCEFLAELAPGTRSVVRVAYRVAYRWLGDGRPPRELPLGELSPLLLRCTRMVEAADAFVEDLDADNTDRRLLCTDLSPEQDVVAAGSTHVRCDNMAASAAGLLVELRGAPVAAGSWEVTGGEVAITCLRPAALVEPP
jgi:hypothetical protein